jgi:outer membrane protein, heavy metal efflux system
MADLPRLPKLLAAVAVIVSAGCISSPPHRLVDFSGIRRSQTATNAVAPIQAADGFATEQRTWTAPSAVIPVAAVTALPLSSDAPARAPDLAEFLAAAVASSPTLKQAAAEVAAARGAAIQAGLYPNPTAGYQGDQIGSGHSAGQQGAFLSQTIVTHGKLALAQAAALAEVSRAEAALYQAQSDLAAQVRARYYALMTATEAVRIADEMARTAEALAERLQKLLESGQPVAPHEVAQARALAAVARGELVQARNRRVAAATQLATIVGAVDTSSLPAPAIDRPPPAYSFDRLRDRILAEHSELRAAAAQVQRAKFQLELARVQPKPNVETHTYVQYDYQNQTPQFGVQLGVALPVFDRNQGNIAQAEANFARASFEVARVRLDLTQRLAEAYERYSSNRRLLDQYRKEILPQQLQAFDGLKKRFEQEPGKVSFTDVVLAQQTLAQTYQGYLNVLSAAWQAVAELSRLAQTDAPGDEVSPPGGDSWPDPGR